MEENKKIFSYKVEDFIAGSLYDMEGVKYEVFENVADHIFRKHRKFGSIVFLENDRNAIFIEDIESM